jgi:ABC-2 type transport system permease protein
MNQTSSAIRFQPVAPDAWHAFQGVWRLTLRRFLAPGSLLALLFLLVLLGSASLWLGVKDDAKFYFNWTARFYLMFIVPTFSFLVAGAAMREEMKAVASDYLLTRALRKPLFLFFKFVAHLAAMQVAYGLGLAVLTAAALYRGIPVLIPALPWLLLAQALAVTAFTALGFFCAVLSARFLVIGFVYAGIVEVALGNIPTQLNRLAMTQHLRMLLEPVFLLVDPSWPQQHSVALSSAVLAGFALVLLTLAAVVFGWLELAGGRDS